MEFINAYEEHVWDVYGYLAYRCRSEAEAEELTQQTFENALRAWKRFDPARGALRSWLLAIARNVYIDARRREAARPSFAVADPPERRDTPEADPAERPEVDPELLAAIGLLGRREREAIALRFGGDLTTAQIAELLDVSLASAQQTLSRALRRLRSILGVSPSSPRPDSSQRHPEGDPGTYGARSGRR